MSGGNANCDDRAHSGHKVIIEYGTVGTIIARLKAGDAIDVAIVTDKQLPDLTRLALILADGQGVIAKVGLGVFVRKGEAEPAVNSLNEFKKTLLSAKSIVYGDPKLGDSSGVAAAAIFERLRIATEMKPKAKLVAAGAKGEPRRFEKARHLAVSSSEWM